MIPEIITKDCRPMTPGERLRAYLERREYALAAGHGVTCEVVAKPQQVWTEYETALVLEPNTTATIRFLRKGGEK